MTDVRRRILGVTGTWDLFARGDDVIVRIEPAHGRVTATIVPELASSGPVSFVALPDAVVVVPLDYVPGFGVADGETATTLTGLGTGGPVFPGQHPGQLWVVSGILPSDPVPMTLLGADGMPTGSTLVTPAGATIQADGAGYLIYTTRGGVTVDVRPRGRCQVSTGPLLAVGPTRWLTAEYHRGAVPAPNHRCVDVVTDSRTGKRRILGPRNITATGALGVISPDGRTAALPRPARSSWSTCRPGQSTRSASRPAPRRGTWSGPRTVAGCSRPPPAGI